MLLAHGTVIAVVDGKNFELYRNAGNEAEPDLSALPTPKLDEHNKGAGAHHYSSSGNPTGHLLDEDAHAAAVAGWLNSEVLGHKIETLVVFAAPRTLGELRKHYHKMTERALAKEVSKDMIGKQAHELVEALRANA